MGRDVLGTLFLFRAPLGSYQPRLGANLAVGTNGRGLLCGLMVVQPWSGLSRQEGQASSNRAMLVFNYQINYRHLCSNPPRSRGGSAKANWEHTDRARVSLGEGLAWWCGLVSPQSRPHTGAGHPLPNEAVAMGSAPTELCGPRELSQGAQGEPGPCRPSRNRP